MTLRINYKNIEKKILWFVTTFMFVSLYIFSTYTWGRYVLAVSSAFVFAIGVILRDGFSYKIKVNMFHIIQIIFCVYCLFSSIWAINPSGALSRSFTMAQIIIFFAMLMSYFIRFNSIEQLLSVVMWSGYAIAIYTFIYYGGISVVKDFLSTSHRITNDFANANSIGMICAIACILQFYKTLYTKKYVSIIFLIPTIIILAACQSRKSILMLIIGIVAIMISKNLNNKNWLLSIIKILISLVIILFALKYLLNLDIFSGMNKRIESLFLFFSIGEADPNTSTGLRLKFIDIGTDYFSRRPLLGYGFGSSGIILDREMSQNTYFHNNFIELLVSGGLIGFTLYYFNYAYLLYNLIKLRKYSIKETDICIIILLILLIMDYGMVSYVGKVQYFYFMICYIQVEILKRERNKYETQNNL